MKVNQVYELTNMIAGELLGDSVIVAEDLSNVVEVGTAFQNAAGGLDNYVRSLNDHIGRMVFVNRVYSGRVPSVLMDGWEFGSILEKVSAKLPDAEANESWELQDGVSYDPNIFYKPEISVSFWNKRITFEIPVSITERQVKSAFSNATQLNAFVSMIYTAISNAMTIRLDALVMRTINNMVAETLRAEYPSANYTEQSGVKAVNLLYLFNHRTATVGTLTAAEAISNPEFIRFAAYTMRNYVDYMRVMSTRFNIGAQERFTPADRLHWVALSSFINAADVYLQSDTFHDEYTRLPQAETIPYWQGSGQGFDFGTASAIMVKPASDPSVTVDASGILAVMFDRDALGVTNMDRRVTTNYNPKAEFWNEWHKMDAGYFNDLNENFVVFFVA